MIGSASTDSTNNNIAETPRMEINTQEQADADSQLEKSLELFEFSTPLPDKTDGTLRIFHKARQYNTSNESVGGRFHNVVGTLRGLE